MPAGARILIADDEANTLEGLRWALEGAGVAIQTAGDGEAAWRLVQSDPPDLLLTDLRMPKLDGMELLRRVRDAHPDTEVIVLTGHGTVESAVEAMKRGAVDYLIKPINIEELRITVQRVLDTARLRRENEDLRRQLDAKYGFENIIGQSQAMQQVFHQVRQVAPTRASVLIQGESGTGKELIAHAIHQNSPRRRQPFIAVNCGALSPTLLESELFGHERGAFTGADQRRKGRFELAHGGTLFLDEISEISLDLQVKLLRVLQEQAFERVGGTETLRIDIRVIAATNRDIDAMVREERFREDLFYRLNVVRIVVPPLREREEDIPLLANAFLREFSEINGKPLRPLSPKVIAALQAHRWPGNVRQLRNVIEGLVVMATGREITVKNLPPDLRDAAPHGRTIALPAGISMREAEKEIIRAALRETDGNRARAAKMLGLGRKTLYRKMDLYGLD
ncbi:MAG: sigma-54-dependent Fis family transcriptional regulator [Candidatus Sumerlaeia bacterium]|nr:sigma-54-dependent Fis family transcriptional regulator [Candidatus Sumerlaeia bacterium]